MELLNLIHALQHLRTQAKALEVTYFGKHKGKIYHKRAVMIQNHIKVQTRKILTFQQAKYVQWEIYDHSNNKYLLVMPKKTTEEEVRLLFILKHKSEPQKVTKLTTFITGEFVKH